METRGGASASRSAGRNLLERKNLITNSSEDNSSPGTLLDRPSRIAIQRSALPPARLETLVFNVYYIIYLLASVIKFWLCTHFRVDPDVLVYKNTLYLVGLSLIYNCE